MTCVLRLTSERLETQRNARNNCQQTLVPEWSEWDRIRTVAYDLRVLAMCCPVTQGRSSGPRTTTCRPQRHNCPWRSTCKTCKRDDPGESPWIRASVTAIAFFQVRHPVPRIHSTPASASFNLAVKLPALAIRENPAPAICLHRFSGFGAGAGYALTILTIAASASA